MDKPRTQVRALSIRQPWASLILAGHKPVENRSRRTAYRGLLVVHAGLRTDRSPEARALATRYRVDETTGAFLGTVDLHDCHQMPELDWCDCDHTWAQPTHTGRRAWHWLVRNPMRFAAPIPGRGALGLFKPPEHLTTPDREDRWTPAT